MRQNSRFRMDGLIPVLALCACVALSWRPLFADGVTRQVEPVPGGCRVTLAWDFSGKVDSDLVIEERFRQGWYVDNSTVPFGMLDASWFSGSTARFAVKPSVLAAAGSISFVVVPGDVAAPSTVSGNWKIYIDGTRMKGSVSGQQELQSLGGALAVNKSSVRSGVKASSNVVKASVAITSFKMTDGLFRELAYSGVAVSGILVVEGCEGLGKAWKEIKRMAVSAGDGIVALEPREAGSCCFMRLKLLTDKE